MNAPPPSPVEGKTWEDWINESIPKIKKAQAMLEESLNKGTAEYNAQAAAVEDFYRVITDVLAEANAWLDWWEYVELMKMDRDRGTVSERAVELKVKVAGPRMLRDKIKGLSEALKARMKRAQWQI